ncbi:MAG: tryptophan 2,3-dioxygenase [Gemmatimonadetes bacterium]|nr:tryptophan 2,3-dioxygenase [Gemmatimonadota bacterium]MBI3568735.1 tryptophan 2,3-dioxygenase [Gemmatimonadota bacterium]
MSDVNYGSYLALDDLLALQRPRSTPQHPDELLFIVVHQASELWFKVILHEFESLVAHLAAGSAPLALQSMKRINGLVGIVSNELSALDTLPPQRFAQFRGYLGASSGSQSVQFRAIEAVSGLRGEHFMHAITEHGPIPPLVQRALDRPTLQQLFLDMLASNGVRLEQVYADDRHATYQLLAEALLEYEQGFARWRFLHVQLVERIIGPGTGGTGGTLGARYLQKTISQRFFPDLWSVRAKFFGGGAATP